MEAEDVADGASDDARQDDVERLPAAAHEQVALPEHDVERKHVEEVRRIHDDVIHSWWRDVTALCW